MPLVEPWLNRKSKTATRPAEEACDASVRPYRSKTTAYTDLTANRAPSGVRIQKYFFGFFLLLLGAAANNTGSGTGRRKCPYEFKVTPDGRMIVDGEDFGDAERFFAEGERLRSLVRLWHDVARAQTA